MPPYLKRFRMVATPFSLLFMGLSLDQRRPGAIGDPPRTSCGIPALPQREGP
jgi:hypothetical protein